MVFSFASFKLALTPTVQNPAVSPSTQVSAQVRTLADLSIVLAKKGESPQELSPGPIKSLSRSGMLTAAVTVPPGAKADPTEVNWLALSWNHQTVLF